EKYDLLYYRRTTLPAQLSFPKLHCYQQCHQPEGENVPTLRNQRQDGGSRQDSDYLRREPPLCNGCYHPGKARPERHKHSIAYAYESSFAPFDAKDYKENQVVCYPNSNDGIPNPGKARPERHRHSIAYAYESSFAPFDAKDYKENQVV